MLNELFDGKEGFFLEMRRFSEGVSHCLESGRSRTVLTGACLSTRPRTQSSRSVA